MKLIIMKSFSKDVSKIKDQKLRKRLKDILLHLQSNNLEYLKKFGIIESLVHVGKYYKIRIGAYRIWCVLENNTLILHRFLHRKDIYRKFP